MEYFVSLLGFKLWRIRKSIDRPNRSVKNQTSKKNEETKLKLHKYIDSVQVFGWDWGWPLQIKLKRTEPKKTKYLWDLAKVENYQCWIEDLLFMHSVFASIWDLAKDLYFRVFCGELVDYFFSRIRFSEKYITF